MFHGAVRFGYIQNSVYADKFRMHAMHKPYRAIFLDIRVQFYV